MHVAVLDPGTRQPELDAFNRMSTRSRIPLTYHLPALHGLSSLRRVEGSVAGVVIFGSGASVHDDLAWQQELREWLAPRVREGLPALGLCYGHQLLAHLLGGEVGFLFPDRSKTRGLREVAFAPTRLWGPERRGQLLVTHREAVTRLPATCDVVASTDLVAVEAFAHRALPVWGIQAHPEATMAFVENNGVPFDASPEVLAFGHGLVDAFFDHVSE